MSRDFLLLNPSMVFIIVIFVDNFTKYVWFSSSHLKSNVFTIFRQYKVVVEIFFQRFILFVYLDGGREYISLKDIFSTMGIQHLKTPSHKPQHNGTFKRLYKHIVDSSPTLLY